MGTLQWTAGSASEYRATLLRSKIRNSSKMKSLMDLQGLMDLQLVIQSFRGASGPTEMRHLRIRKAHRYAAGGRHCQKPHRLPEGVPQLHLTERPRSPFL